VPQVLYYTTAGSLIEPPKIWSLRGKNPAFSISLKQQPFRRLSGIGQVLIGWILAGFDDFFSPSVE
jgi:hypothetical protein